MDLINNDQDIFTFFRAIQPIETYLPPDEKSKFNSVSKVYSHMLPNGYLERISSWYEQETIKDMTYQELIDTLKSDQIEPSQLYVVEYNIEQHATKFIENICDIDTIKESHYAKVLNSIINKNNKGNISTEDVLKLICYMISNCSSLQP